MSTNWTEGVRPGFIGSKNIFAKIKPNQNIYIETGAWRGAGIKWAIENFNKVHSIELWEEYYNNMGELFKDNNKVHMLLGESRTKLPELLSKIDEKCFIFLDAHGDINETGLNPLYEEIKEIDQQIETEAAAEPEGEGEDQYQSFVPKGKGNSKFMKEDIKLKKDMNDIMKTVLAEPQN